MNKKPCCKECEIYLDYKDGFQCNDGECHCHTKENTNKTPDLVDNHIDNNNEPAPANEKYANFRHAKEITVLKIEVNEGKGVGEDPMRRVAYLVTKEGKVLAKIGEAEERLFAGVDEMINL